MKDGDSWFRLRDLVGLIGGLSIFFLGGFAKARVKGGTTGSAVISGMIGVMGLIAVALLVLLFNRVRKRAK